MKNHLTIIVSSQTLDTILYINTNSIKSMVIKYYEKSYVLYPLTFFFISIDFMELILIYGHGLLRNKRYSVECRWSAIINQGMHFFQPDGTVLHYYMYVQNVLCNHIDHNNVLKLFNMHCWNCKYNNIVLASNLNVSNVIIVCTESSIMQLIR